MNRRGFLLLEVIVSIAIVTISLFAVMRSFSHSKVAILRSAELLKATSFLENKMWEWEQVGEIKAGVQQGNFSGNEKMNWSVNAIPIENSGLNVVTLEVFKKDDPKKASHFIQTYLKNKTK